VVLHIDRDYRVGAILVEDDLEPVVEHVLLIRDLECAPARESRAGGQYGQQQDKAQTHARIIAREKVGSPA
jgi:hypothetical protein